MEHKKLEVGDALWCQPKDRRGNPIGEPTEVVVGKVGNKYFYLKDDGRQSKYDIETLRHISSASSMFNVQLYRTEQEILDKRETDNLKLSISSAFANYRFPDLTLDQLRRIHNIINEK